MHKRITAFAPATVANVGCAFDVLGFALLDPGDTVTAEAVAAPGVQLTSVTGDGGKLPKESATNCAGVAVAALWDAARPDFGVNLSLTKGLPLGSGMGSSAASSAAALFAANRLLKKPLPPLELVPFAMEGERLACGSAHADNVAPALLGGFALIRSYSPLDVIKLPAPSSLHVTICHPQIEINTKDARDILKKKVPLATAVAQWGNVAGLVAGILQSDFELMRRSLLDHIVEPERTLLVPGYEAVKNAALQAGALNCNLSGSGPAVFSFSRNAVDAREIALAMAAAFKTVRVASESFISRVNNDGPCIIAAE